LTRAAPSLPGRHFAADLAQPQIDALDARQALPLGDDHEEHLLRQVVDVAGGRAEAEQVGTNLRDVSRK
jgi:hypothetical protein